MPYCTICGIPIENGLYCRTHLTETDGRPNAEETPAMPNEEQEIPLSLQEEQDRGDVYQETPNSTTEKPPKKPLFPPQERESLLGGMMCYLGPMVLIPLLFGRKNHFVRFHAVQGFTLLVLELLTALVCVVIRIVDPLMPPVTPLLMTGGELMGLTSLVLSGMGMAHVLFKKTKELPLIGGCRLVRLP